MSDCVLDECRSFDPETGDTVYEVICFNSDHADRTCPAEREMFRIPKETAHA